MSGSNIPPLSTGSAKPAAPQGQVVQIVSLPDALKNTARALRIEGEVVQQNSNGSTRIKTPQGDMDVTIRGKQLQPGTKVEIDIPAGSPPRNVTVRPAPAQPQTPSPPPSSSPPRADVTDILPQPQQPQAPAQTKPAQGQAQTPTHPTTTPAPSAPPQQGNVTSPQQTTMPPNTDGAAKPAAPPNTAGQTPQAQQQTQQAVSQAQLPPLPPLKPGAIVTLTPLPLAAENASGAAKSPALQTADTPFSNGAAQTKPASGLLGQVIQAVKSVVPSAILPQGLPVKPAILTNGIATPQIQLGNTQVQISPMLPSSIPTLMAKILSITLPSGETLSLLPNTTGAAGTAAAPVQTTSLHTTSVQTPVVQPGGNAPITTPSLITAPHLATPAPQAPAIDITVSQVTAQNQPIIPVPMNTSGAVQNFVLQAPPATVPVGTQITMEPVLLPSANAIPQGDAPHAAGSLPSAAGPGSLPPAWRALMPLMQPSTLWPVMDELFQSFYQATPQAAQILGRTIPSPATPANFGPAMMIFAAALKSGDLQGWLGDKKLEMVHKLGKDSILSRMRAETATLAGNTDTPATEWKSFPVPLLWQNEISKIMFHVRREPPEEDNEQAESGTRFILDLSLSRMGDVQLDGLLRGSRLDLIVRTQMAVSEPMQEAMRKAYADALDGSGIYGELGFQGDMKNWLRVSGREDSIAATA